MKVLKHSGSRSRQIYLSSKYISIGKKGDCMHYMIANFSNSNCQFYHPPDKEIERWYTEEI